MEECVLIMITNSKDEDGFPVVAEERITVPCEEKSIRFSEFYEAQRSGYKPRIILELRNEDWELTERVMDGRKTYATHVEYDGADYDVIRYYKKNKAKIQITLGEVASRW